MWAKGWAPGLPCSLGQDGKTLDPHIALGGRQQAGILGIHSCFTCSVLQVNDQLQATL